MKKSNFKEWWSGRTKSHKIMILGVLSIIVLAAIVKQLPQPDPCNCARLLEIKKDVLDTRTYMTNEEYLKWKECKRAYAGPNDATVNCWNKNKK